jgi:hypothetical protein
MEYYPLWMVVYCLLGGQYPHAPCRWHHRHQDVAEWCSCIPASDFRSGLTRPSGILGQVNSIQFISSSSRSKSQANTTIGYRMCHITIIFEFFPESSQ